MNPNVAVIQINASNNVLENLSKAENFIEQAKVNNADMIALPENFAFLGHTDTAKIDLAESLDAPGPILQALSRWSKQYQIWLLAGTVPLKSAQSRKVFVSSLLYCPQGECVARYDKIHLFDVIVEDVARPYQESKTVVAGNKIVCYQTPWGKVGLSVCYDLRFPELYRMLQKEGVEIFFVPSAFTFSTGKVHWETLLKARAIENLAFVVAPNQVGKHANERDSYGHSMIVDPWGDVIAEMYSGEGVVLATLDRNQQKTLRTRFPSVEQRKL